MSKNAHPEMKQLRAIGHKLKPVVTVAGKGLTDSVMAEICLLYTSDAADEHRDVLL